MELTIKCKNWMDQMGFAHEMVGDDVSFSFKAETGWFSIDVESEKEAQDLVTQRFSLYSLDSEPNYLLIEENTKPKELTAY
jgi:hypothetical protein